MTRVFIYIMSVVSNCDSMEADNVPFVVNKKLLFFGPCKRYLRQKLKSEYLGTKNFLSSSKFSQKENKHENDEIYFVGLNGSNNSECRKILWAGKMISMMTYKFACNNLKAQPYQCMITADDTPLLVTPTYTGYKKRGKLHISPPNSAAYYWFGDFTSKRIKGKKLDSQEIQIADFDNELNRDICFLFKNLHAAHPSIGVKEGIQINTEMVSILKKVQEKDKKGIDSYAIFGRQNRFRKDGKKVVEGKSGGWLEINADNADEFIKLIKKHRPKPSITISTNIDVSQKKVC